uniref:ribonucleoside-diphosphate reductase n=1 Tax=Nilaparvata lugens endogenous nudivirus TaxID=1487700 RepID=X5GY79_9VIRU|nr:RR2 [Nilaparvata lugens endogenous nudivirus]
MFRTIPEHDNDNASYSNDDDNSIDDIFLPVNNKTRFIYPPNPWFIETYKLWHKHQAVVWTSSEVSPELDRDAFQALEPKFQDICLNMMACLMWGDSTVLEIMEKNIVELITAREVQVLLADIVARENVHEEVYSKMICDLASIYCCSEKYRNDEFKNKYLIRFEVLKKKYIKYQQNPAVFFYFIMLCETILFAPMFQTICYMAYSGSTPILGSINAQVKRDEAIHYRHARLRLSEFKVKMNKKLAREILDDFMSMVESIMELIIGDYKSLDGLYSLAICKQHLKHVCTGIMYENSLYYNSFEMDENIGKYKTTPAALYMDLMKNEVRSNLMESQSTIYAVGEQLSSQLQVKLNIDTMGDW